MFLWTRRTPLTAASLLTLSFAGVVAQQAAAATALSTSEVSTADFTVISAHSAGCNFNNRTGGSVALRLEVQHHEHQTVNSTITFPKIQGAATVSFTPTSDDWTMSLKYLYRIAGKAARYPDLGMGKPSIAFAIGGRSVSLPLKMMACPIFLQ